MIAVVVKTCVLMGLDPHKTLFVGLECVAGSALRDFPMFGRARYSDVFVVAWQTDSQLFQYTTAAVIRRSPDANKYIPYSYVKEKISIIYISNTSRTVRQRVY